MSTPATMISKPQLFFACPHSGADDEHSVTHFLDGRSDHSFGPWQCNACGWVVHGQWHAATQTVSITEIIERPKPIKGYLLLRLAVSKADRPLWFIVEDDIHTRDGVRPWDEEMAGKRYWVEEHTCPTNIVRVEAIIEGAGPDYDADPHGVLEFVAWAPRPVDLPVDAEPEDWRAIFPQLSTETIDGSVVAIAGLLGEIEGET